MFVKVYGGVKHACVWLRKLAVSGSGNGISKTMNSFGPISEQIFGLPLDQVPSMELYRNLIHPDDLPRILEYSHCPSFGCFEQGILRRNSSPAKR